MGKRGLIARILTEDETPQPSVATQPAAPRPASTGFTPAPQAASGGSTLPFSAGDVLSSAPTPTVGTVRQDLLANVRAAVFDKNVTPWVKLQDVANKMKARIPDEATRLAAAIPVVGVTLPELQDALTQHLQALHSVRERYAADADRNRKQQIDSKKSRREEISARLKALEAERAQLQEEDSGLAGQVAAGEAKFAQLDADFAATTTQVEQEINTMITRLPTLFG